MEKFACKGIRDSFRSNFGSCVVSLFLLLAISVLGQESAKTTNGSLDQSEQRRLAIAIEGIPALVAEGMLSQDQANEMTTKLKLKFADLMLSKMKGDSMSLAVPTPAQRESAPPAQVPTVERASSQAAAPSQPAASDPPPTPPQSSSNATTDKPAADKKSSQQSSFEKNFVAGVEQSGYSSQINNTNFFVNAFFRNTLTPSNGPSKIGFDPKFAAWGRIRLLSAPQPSTEGIVSTLTDPTGKLSQTSFTNVGQVADFVIGPEIQIYNWGEARFSFAAGIGASTPLASNTTVATYNVPPAKSVECQELVNRFGPSSGYAPFVSADPAQATCIYNPLTNKPYSYIAFSNQDRSNFLAKWGAGFRLEHQTDIPEKTIDALGTLDFSVGQDETVTGGKLRGWIFKIDGVYPLPIANSILYAFGSASMRFTHNKDLAPLILTVPQGTSIPTIPSEDVIVLPLRQPNRDFYRIGFGLNLMDVFCAFKASGCKSKTDGGDTQANTQKPPATNQSGAPSTNKKR